MNHPWLALVAFYLAVGMFVSPYAKDEFGRPVPWHHFVLCVMFWPLLFILPDHDGNGP
jgi:hypothetical protein